jgi:hypothetical protein
LIASIAPSKDCFIISNARPSYGKLVKEQDHVAFIAADQAVHSFPATAKLKLGLLSKALTMIFPHAAATRPEAKRNILQHYSTVEWRSEMYTAGILHNPVNIDLLWPSMQTKA